jgi:hypothetical protein
MRSPGRRASLEADGRNRGWKPADCAEDHAGVFGIPLHRCRPARADQLRSISGPRGDVHIYSEDCNDVLMWDIFPRAKYNDYRRALCLLDPYNINLKWEVIETAGKRGSVEVFLNFMIMDINRSKVAQLTRLPGAQSKSAPIRSADQTGMESRSGLSLAHQHHALSSSKIVWSSRFRPIRGISLRPRLAPFRSSHRPVQPGCNESLTIEAETLGSFLPGFARKMQTHEGCNPTRT